MKKTRPELRLATAADVEAFYGHKPESTMRGYVAMLDGRPVGIGGITYKCGVLCAFSEIRDELRPYKVSIMKFGRKIVQLFGDAPGMAVASRDEPGSERFLTALGFEHVATLDEGELYRWPQRQ